MTEIKHTVLEIPTARRQANQLFTQHSWGVQLGVTENKSNEWQGRGIEPRMTRLLVQHPNHSATQPPGSLFEFTWQFLEKNVLVYLQALHHQLKTSFLNKQRTSARCLICKCQKELFFYLDSSWKEPYSWFAELGKGSLYCILGKGTEL